MNWKAIKAFNFTWAIPGGAWLEDVTGYVNWHTFTEIERQMGRVWVDKQLKKQGMFTGCWVEVQS